MSDIEKKSFILYINYLEFIEMLSNEQVGSVFRAVFHYQKNGSIAELDGMEKMLFTLIRQDLDYNNKAWADKIKEKSDQGKKGGRPEISQEVKEAICEDLKAGITQKEIAEKYAIAQSTISNIKKEVFDTEYQKQATNIKNNEIIKKHNEYEYEYVNDNDNDISPEISGGEDTAPFSKPQPTHNPEPAALPERPQYTADSAPAVPPETPHAIPDSIFPVAAGCTDTAASPPKQKPKPKKPPLREREPVNDFEIVEKAYLHHWDTLYEAGVVHTADPVINWQQARKLLQGHFKTMPPDMIAQAIKSAAQDSFILKGGYSLTTILSASVLNRLINAHYKPQKTNTPRSPPKNNQYDFNQTGNKKALPF